MEFRFFKFTFKMLNINRTFYNPKNADKFNESFPNK